MTASLSSQTPVAQTYVIGATGKEFVRMNLTAGSGEDVLVTSITLDLISNQLTATSGAHFTNVKLVKEDGTQYGSTVASPVGTASFSGSLTVPAAGTVVLKAIADVPTTSYPRSEWFDFFCKQHEQYDNCQWCFFRDYYLRLRNSHW